MAKRNRILNVICRLVPNGPSLDLADFCNGLDPERCRVAVFVFFKSDPEVVAAVRRGGDIEIYECNLRGFAQAPLGILRLLKAFRRERPDVVQTFDAPVVDWITRVVAWLFRVPLVALGLNITRDHYLVKRGRVAWMFAYAGDRATTPLVTVFVPNSDRVSQYLADVFRVKPARMRTITTGIDPVRFDWCREGAVEARKAFGFRQTDIVIGCVAGVRATKGQVHLIQALERVRHMAPNVRLLLVGRLDPAYWPHVREEIERLKLAHLCKVAGEVHDPKPALLSTDIFVLPSFVEGFPRALVEAMLMGRPCIATSVAGSSEAIVDGISGVLVQPGDAVALAHALAKLASDPVLCAKLGRAARTKARELYSIEQRMQAFSRLYDELTSHTA